NPADTALSVSAVSISEIKIYPNPAKNELFINFPAAENVDNSSNVEIFNITGQRMLSTKYTNHQSINISTLQSGIYILKCGKYYGRFVKN
ncbi:MAG: T9SS type A sorting domain-containing protein, partial [Paludibacter sp.]|nr:T9SS type A sorting domain-containing protein [Paludibacter sp.]